MSNIEFKKIISKDEPIFWSDCKLLNLNNEYILTDSGTLIDNSGNLIWSAKLEHYLSKAIYIKEKEIIITDRIVYLGMGGEFHLGVACIDMKTGQYKWKHFYDEGKSRVNLRNMEPDINMVRNIDEVDTIKGCIYCDGFEIDLDNGSYEYIGETKIEKIKNHSAIYSKTVKSLKEPLKQYSKNSECIKFNIDTIYIEGQEFSKEGYFFNKCDFYMEFNDIIYFFGIPAKRNPKNAILFKYSKIKKNIIEEIEIPIRDVPLGVYDFFGKGVLVILKSDICLVEGLLSVDISEVINKEYSNEEKEKFKELIKIIINLSSKARVEGLLSLENICPYLNPFLLRKGIENVVEGCDVKELRYILDNYIQTKKHYGNELLEKLIIREGVILIKNGDIGKILFNKILIMLGEDFFDNFDYSIFEEEFPIELEYDRNDSKIMFEECNTFEDKIMSIMDCEEMEKLVIRAGCFYIALALKVGSGKLNMHVRDKLSFRYMVDELNYEVVRIGPCRIQDAIDAQKFILSVL